MKAPKVVVLLVLLAVTVTAFGSGQSCPAPRSVQSEAALNNLHSWADAIDYFNQYKACLDGGTSEGFTTFLAEQLAADGGVDQLWAVTRRQIWFREVVAKRMESEVISLDTTKLMLNNLRSHCPIVAKHFCQELTMRIRATCSACTPGP